MIFKAAAAIIILVGLLVTVLNGCRKSDDSQHRPTVINFQVPSGFPEPVYDFAANPVTKEGFDLGKMLFYDNRLSKYLDVSCGSCHQQMAAYTTFDHDLGHGTNHQHTTRNVPGIFNMAWQEAFGWDGEVSTLQEQVLACMHAPEKMGENWEGVLSKIDTIPAYREMFEKAFGSDALNEASLAKSLAQFVVMIVSAESRYDKVQRGEAQFTANQAAGYELFKTHCASCHSEPLFTDNTYRNTGLPHRDFHEDAGRMIVTGDRNDSLKFKVPSLRNVGVTSYYAHDGRFAGITEVMDHYASGIVQTPTLDPLLQQGIQLTNLEKFYIQEFLFSLNDSALVKDPQFR